MNPIGDLLTEMLDGLPLSGGDDRGDSAGEVVHVHSLHLALPIETRIRTDGALLASAPRGRLATGFDPQISMMIVNLERSGT